MHVHFSNLSMYLPIVLLVCSTTAFLIRERVHPGRALPRSKGWYPRALLMNLGQLLITLATAKLWLQVFGGMHLLTMPHGAPPVLQGFAAWLVGTFVFYWWHRLRHASGWWRAFHQIHHSPSRIELVTSFYKHPIEILADSALSAAILYPVLGCTLAGGLWYNLFAATGEYFYHANVGTPRWLRFFIQTPELHSVHHQYGVHARNFADIPLWDRLFGTYEDQVEFVARCGFPEGAEERLMCMLAFNDVYAD
jgi:sterol desaturase/sphingolipid hydroxylase (fatty acid hydroxylase superfamily)